MGAEFDPSAPWNQEDDTPDPIQMEVEYRCTVEAKASFDVKNYLPSVDTMAWEEGTCVTEHDKPDFIETNWLEEFADNIFTPDVLFDILIQTAQALADGRVPNKTVRYWQKIATDAALYVVKDEEIDY